MTDRRRYHPSDSSDRHWQRLLQYALGKADTFECAIPYPVVLQDLAHAPLWPTALQAFRRNLIDRHASVIRWELRRDYATQFVRFQLTAPLLNYIRSFPQLEAWRWDYGAPEDPAFFSGEAVLLATESAQGRIAVYADAAELAALTGAGIRLLEPLGVTAEPWPTP